MNISIRCPDNLYKLGLHALLCEIFTQEMEQHVLTFLEYHPNKISSIDMTILMLSPGEHYICHSEFYTYSPRLVIGLVDRQHIPARGEIPSCISRMVFIPSDATASQMEALIRHHWLLAKNENLISMDRSCLCCPRKTFTAQQRQLIYLLLSGLTPKQIGMQLGICHKTVLAHRHALMNKFRLKSDCELLQFLNAAQEKRVYSTEKPPAEQVVCRHGRFRR